MFDMDTVKHSRPRNVIVEAPNGRIICKKTPINLNAHHYYPRYEIALTYKVYTEIKEDVSEQVLKGINMVLPGIYTGGNQKFILKKLNRATYGNSDLELYYLRFLSRINFTLPTYKQIEFIPFVKVTDTLPTFVVTNKATIGTFEFTGINDLQYLKKYLSKEYDK